MNTVLIATHGNKDVSWIKEISVPVNIKIYCVVVDSNTSLENKNKIYITPNKGMDSNAYLRYIIDNYNNLAMQR